jgi:hypothetical protein
MMMIDMSGFRGQMSDNRGRMEERLEDEAALLTSVFYPPLSVGGNLKPEH